MRMVRPATLWYRVHDDHAKFNHLELSVARRAAPVPRSELQRKAWGGVFWLQQPAFLIDGCVRAVS